MKQDDNLSHEKIVSRLSHLIDSPTSDILYCITTHHVVQQIAHRMGSDALSLTEDDLQLAREEVFAVLQHRLDYRTYIDEALDIWEISRHL